MINNPKLARNKKVRLYFASVLCFLLTFSSVGITAFADIDEGDINFFLEKIATTKNEFKKDMGIFLLEDHLDKENPDVESLKSDIKKMTPSDDKEKLQKKGYTLDEALQSLDVFEEMDREDIKSVIQALKDQDVNELQDIIGEYTKNDVNEENGGVTPSLEDGSVGELVKVEFSDINNHWAREDIEFLALRSIIKGQSDGVFNPDGNITRAEFTALVVRVFDLKAKNSTFSKFNDVSEEAWYYSIVNVANQYGLVNGINSDSFAPNSQISREQMVSIIMRALNVLAIDNTEEKDICLDIFNDKDELSDWASDNVEKALKFGIINGKQENMFFPKGLATRAESSAIIKRVYYLMDNK